MSDNRILLSLPTMGGAETGFIERAFADGWVAPAGPNISGFEADLSKYLGAEGHVVALSSGTSAIHLALVQLGVGPGDEVICQSFTFAASANPIAYQGASPVFVDSEPDTWNMSPEWLERAIVDRIAKTGRAPKAIIPVHLYGMPAKMDEICAVAERHKIPIVEDAAEALGSEYKGRKCGTFGEFAALSFNGNKIITTSGGGALVCRTEQSAARALFYATQARENRPYYHHEHIGYNYRMSNICAGIGRGQMQVLQERVDRRRAIHALYSELLRDTEVTTPAGGSSHRVGRRWDEAQDELALKIMESPHSEFHTNYWLTCVVFDEAAIGSPVCPGPPSGADRGSQCDPMGYTEPNAVVERARRLLAEAGIESRPLWKPLHLQPVFAAAPFYGDGTAEGLFKRGLCLPSGSNLSDGDVRRVAARIKLRTCLK